MSDPLSGFKIRAPIQLRFRDTDAMGHVNNAVYLSLLEIARMKYWEEVFGVSEYGSVDFILARVEIDYRSPAKLGDELVIGLKTTELKRSSWVFDYKIVDMKSGRLIAAAKTVQVTYDYKADKVKRMSPEFRKKLAAFDGLG